MWAAGAEISSRTVSFVCQTTPHFGSTSREVSYSVPPYHTSNYRKSKSLFRIFLPIKVPFGQIEELALKIKGFPLAICALFHYNGCNLEFRQEVRIWVS